MIFCVGVEPHASYSCLQNNCNMMNNKLNCETIFATLYFLHPSKCLQALLMVPYLDSHGELGIHFYCSEFNTSIYNSRHARYGKCFFVCHLCCSRHFGFPFVHLRIFCSLFESPWWWHICNPRGPPIYIHMRENQFRFHPLV